jgi:quaternary ammonium compound-resistance protein SugE
MAWVLIGAAAVLEVVWAVAFKQSDGMTRLGPTALGVTAAIASVVLLTMALRSLPVGPAYAVWTGLGAFGVALVGVVALGEGTSALRLGCLALIVSGVVGLRFAGG